MDDSRLIEIYLLDLTMFKKNRNYPVSVRDNHNFVDISIKIVYIYIYILTMSSGVTLEATIQISYETRTLKPD